MYVFPSCTSSTESDSRSKNHDHLACGGEVHFPSGRGSLPFSPVIVFSVRCHVIQSAWVGFSLGNVNPDLRCRGLDDIMSGAMCLPSAVAMSERNNTFK